MARKGYIQGGQGGCKGVLAAYPEIVKTIMRHLEVLRDSRAPLTLVLVRGVVTATILRMSPEIFENSTPDGSQFRCSNSFLRSFLREHMHWSERHATRDAHKLPADWEAQCRKAILRIVHDIKEYDIPSSLYVNTDQTNMVYVQGSKLTWAPVGSKQVSVVSMEEKCAVTLCVSVANSGVLLPFQAVYMGGTYQSTPKRTAEHYEETYETGMRYEYGTRSSYWSTQRTMQALVDEIICPVLRPDAP